MFVRFEDGVTETIASDMVASSALNLTDDEDSCSFGSEEELIQLYETIGIVGSFAKGGPSS